MRKAEDIIRMLNSEDKTALHKYLGMKHYTNVDDFVKDYITASNSGDKKEFFNTTALLDRLLPGVEKDFEKNGIYYIPFGGTIKRIKQHEDVVSILLSTVGGYKSSTSSDTTGTPDFALIFSVKENTPINAEKGDVIDFIGYSEDKLVLILKGEPLKVNTLDINEIHAVKLSYKMPIEEPAKKARPR